MSDSRRSKITKPNTKSPKVRKITCKVRGCKKVKNLNIDGYCESRARRPLQTGDLYDKCQECSEVVSEKQSGITCDKCEIWHHIECVNISDDQYKSLVSASDHGSHIFHWYCQFCRPKCVEAVAKIELLESQTRNLATNMAKLTERVGKLENNLGKEVKSNVRIQLDEKADIDKRKMNLIVCNMRESEPPNALKGSAWYTDDKKNCGYQELFKNSRGILRY